MSLVETRPPTVEEVEKYEAHLRTRLDHVAKLALRKKSPH